MRADFGLDVVRRPIADRALLLRLASLPPAAPGASYDVWLRASARALRTQAKARLAGPVVLTLHIEDRHPRRDAASCLLPVCEALIAAGVLLESGARSLRSVTVEWCAVRGIVIRLARSP